MTWVKLDDQLHSHPKIKRAWKAHPAALGLHLRALSHAGAYFYANGHVPEDWVMEEIPRATVRRKLIQVLVGAGLWEPVPGGWLIRGFKECNPPKGAKKTANGSPDAPSLLDVIDASHPRARAHTPAGTRAARPDPTRPDLSHPSIGEARA